MERENRYYDQIMELNGMEDMKEEVRHWEILAENIGQFPLEQEILLPDYFWIAPSGSGKSMLLNLLANYLEDREIMTFTGNKKVIEFELGYCKKEESFGELSRLIEKISYEAGYRQRFRGILAVHISAWAGHMHEKYMYSFLEFLAENTKDWLIVLIADVDKEQAQIMKKQIAYHLRIKTVEIRLPKVNVLYEYLEKKCGTYGIQISEEAGQILKDTIHTLKDSSHFEGYNTLNLMVQEMIYELYSKQRLVSKTITGDMLSAYGAKGDYTKNYMETVSKKQKIGFSYEKQEDAE